MLHLDTADSRLFIFLFVVLALFLFQSFPTVIFRSFDCHSFAMRAFSSLLALGIALPALVAGELSGTVGPTTSHAAKAKVKTCKITDYGGVADGKTDIGTALNDAFTACKSGGVVVIPEGDYAMSTWVKLANGKDWALQLDGTITRTGTDGGNMIMIEHASNFEMFSSTGKGAIQGNGYEFHAKGSTSGPRLLRKSLCLSC